MEELFQAEAGRTSAGRAHFWYWRQSVRAWPSLLAERLYWKSMMIRNYALIALRNIRKQKIFSLINILGFSVSLSLGLLVIAILAGFFRQDRFHADAGRIYRVISAVEDPIQFNELATAPLPLRGELERVAGVESVVRLRHPLAADAVCGDRIIPVSGLFADREFFSFFSFKLDKGRPETALAEPFTAVLTRELASKFFPKQDPLGQVLTISGWGDFRVTGLVEDLSAKPSHIRFELLASMSTLASLEEGRRERAGLQKWTDFNYGYVYVKLAEKASPGTVLAALPGIVGRNIAHPRLRVTLSLQNLKDISPGSSLSNEISAVVPWALVLTLLGIALVILAIAGFNYMNLSVVKAVQRGREVGLRKVLGARRGNLVAQFMGEAVVIALLSLVLAFGLLQVLKPLVLNLNPEFRTFFRLDSPGFELLPAFLIFTVLAGMAAGFFPALVLSRFQPALVLKDAAKVRGRKRFRVRTGLILSQFVLSFLFLTTTIVGLRQVRFLRTADTGFTPAGILNVELQGVPWETFKQAVAGHPAVGRISASSYLPNTGVSWIEPVRIGEAGGAEEIGTISVDESFLENLGLRLVAGRGFPDDARSGGEIAVLVNETTARRFGGESPAGILGKTMTFENGTPLPVAGIVGDFLAQNYNGAVEPLVIRRAPEQFRYANVKLDPARIPEAMAFLEAQWKKLRPGILFRAAFYDDQLREGLVFFDANLKVLAGIAFLAVLISLLGLLGMAVFEAESRIKEIGIRRTLGASSADIFFGMSRKFLGLLLAAAGLAAPLAWWLNNLYLQTFIRRIRLGPAPFLSSAGLILGLAALIVGIHARRAARVNPAVSLRHE